MKNINPKELISIKQIKKPLKDFNYILDLLLPKSIPKALPARNVLVLNPPDDNGWVYLFPNKTFTTYRKRDRLLIKVGEAPTLIGLSEHVQSIDIYSIVASHDLHYNVIKFDDAVSIINSHNAWRSVASMFSWYIHIVSSRDEKLVGVGAYDMVRSQLFDIMNLPEDVRLKTTVAKFIVTRTRLSRSMVMKILSDLTKGGYIYIEKGILLSINRLPEKY